MTTFYLIRHGSNDYLTSTLIGRRAGISLNATGQLEAEVLGENLAKEKIQSIFSSPMERCVETAGPLSRRLGLKIEISEALNEVNFGDWTAKTFVELDAIESWKQWNTFRSGSRAPNGESMLEVQARFVGALERWRREFEGRRIAVFSHGDPIRAALLFYLGIPFEFIRRIDLSPASVSIVEFNPWELIVRCVNRRFESMRDQST